MAEKIVNRKTFKVLLVEDEPLVQKVHRMMLERMGYCVDLAENGQTAIALSLNAYDIILMDLGLPDMTGIEAAISIRQMSTLKHVPIVAVTAYIQKEIHEECGQANFIKIVTKPISGEILQNLLQDILIK